MNIWSVMLLPNTRVEESGFSFNVCARVILISCMLEQPPKVIKCNRLRVVPPSCPRPFYGRGLSRGPALLCSSAAKNTLVAFIISVFFFGCNGWTGAVSTFFCIFLVPDFPY